MASQRLDICNTHNFETQSLRQIYKINLVRSQIFAVELNDNDQQVFYVLI